MWTYYILIGVFVVKAIIPIHSINYPKRNIQDKYSGDNPAILNNYKATPKIEKRFFRNSIIY